MFEIQGKYTTAKVMIDNVEESCIGQITQFVNHPAFCKPVSIMPDTHAGKGSVIGFTMELSDKVIPNVVGVDIGCFPKNMEVQLADNRKIKFSKLITEFKAGKDNYCFAKDDDGNIVITKILNVLKTRTVTKLAKVTLDNDEIIYCTVDHIFYTRTNQEIKAEDLDVDASLMPLYIEYAKNVPFEKLSKKNKRYKLKNYLVVYNPNSGLYDFIHRLADDYNARHNLLCEGTIRHHKDLNKYNNNPTNISRMFWKDHFKLHAEHAAVQNKKGNSGWSVSWKKNREKFSKLSSEKMKKMHADQEFSEKLKRRSAATFKKFCESDKFKEMVELSGVRGKKYLINYSKSKKSRAKSKEISNRQYECPKCNMIIKSPIGVHIRYKHKELSFDDFKLVKNHKVKKIKLIDCKPTDVYCLTTEFGNFALAAGVFVHNCGMLSTNFGKDFPLTLEELDRKIREKVPFGHDTHESSVINFEKEFPWKSLNLRKEEFTNAFQNKFNIYCRTLSTYDMNWFISKCESIGANTRRMINSIGTLGGGNHFIETGISSKGEYWITIHSGSRNFGKRICEYWQRIAEKRFTKEFSDKKQEEIEQIKLQYQGDERYQKIQEVKSKYKIGINTNGLEWLEDEGYFQYLFDMLFAQMYASVNRSYIASIIQKIIGKEPIDKLETIHNFIDFHDFIIRKGAIRSYKNEKMIIPFNMHDGILLCEGLSNPEWNYSAPHGAGRVMSRSQAKKQIDLEQFKKQMQGIYSTSVGQGTLDEAPGAYKDSSIIEEAISPTAIIIDKIKPIHNMKDGEG